MTDIININIPLILQTNLVFTEDRRPSTGLDNFLNFRFFREVAAVHGIRNYNGWNATTLSHKRQKSY